MLQQQISPAVLFKDIRMSEIQKRQIYDEDGI